MRLALKILTLALAALSLSAKVQSAEPAAPTCISRSSNEIEALARARALLLQTGGDADLAALFADPRTQQALQDGRKRIAQDWAELCYYRADNAKLAQAPRPDTIFIGDSITENWGYDDPALFDGRRRVSRGISGQTSRQILLRFYQDVVHLRPRAVHIMAGTNDLAGNNGPSSDDDVVNNFAAMIDIATASDIHVIVATIPPAARFPWSGISASARIERINIRLKAIALQRRAVVVDYGTVLDDGKGGIKSGLSNDGVHPNSAGYGLMRPLAEAALRRAVRR